MHSHGISNPLGTLIAAAALAAAMLAGSPLRADGQQPDSMKHKMPGMAGMKMPATKKPAAPSTTKTKTKAATTKVKSPTSKPATTKAGGKNHAPAKKRCTPKADSSNVHAGHMQMPDSMHKDTPDSMHLPMHDTTHASMPDSTHLQMPDTMHMPHDTMHMATGDTMPMAMSMAGPLGISMERMGSGTTWIPDAVMLPSRHWMLGNWMVMLHGFVFGQYDQQSGPRGAHQWGSLNWGMLMADREVGGGRLQFRFMPSLDPATVGKCGYPLLLQSGETCGGKPLVDRQHPHDFFMELGAVYERPVSSNLALLFYAAPAGEPALGPVAFMHRPSAMDEPMAPLGHHWQDATHISFGVATVGIFTRTVRLEGSAFNGHEPDESRWNFDPIALNSYSARLTINPTAHWSFTTGYGQIDNPERGSPPESMHRLVASAMHGSTIGAAGQWTSTLIFGRNTHEGGEKSSGALIESEAVLDQHNTVFGRAESVQKSGGDLQLAGVPVDEKFNIAALSLGYIRELSRGRGMTLGIGARGSVNFVPAALEVPYGSRTPVGAMVFLRLRPYHSQPHTAMNSKDGSPHSRHSSL